MSSEKTAVSVPLSPNVDIVTFTSFESIISITAKEDIILRGADKNIVAFAASDPRHVLLSTLFVASRAMAFEGQQRLSALAWKFGVLVRNSVAAIAGSDSGRPCSNAVLNVPRNCLAAIRCLALSMHDGLVRMPMGCLPWTCAPIPPTTAHHE